VQRQQSNGACAQTRATLHGRDRSGPAGGSPARAVVRAARVRTRDAGRPRRRASPLSRSRVPAVCHAPGVGRLGSARVDRARETPWSVVHPAPPVHGLMWVVPTRSPSTPLNRSGVLVCEFRSFWARPRLRKSGRPAHARGGLDFFALT
jgi:hypothetical protein